MADLRTSFIVLEDSATQAGLPMHKALEGELVANKNGHAAFVAKDSALKFKYLEVDDAGALKVSTGADYACLSDEGTNAGSTSDVDLITLPLVAEKVYYDIEALLSCFRDSVFKIVWSNDGVETVLVPGVRVGAGDYNEMLRFQCMEFTAGATGVQSLIVRGKNLQVASTLDATISIKEKAY